MHNHTGCICSIFLHCVLSDVHSMRIHKRMHSHTGCICKTFLHCVFSNGPSIHSHKKMQSHTGCICLSSHHYVFSNVSSEHLHKRKHSCTGCICWASPRYESAYMSYMSFDNGCMLECIVTLEAFVDIRPGHRLVCEFSISLSISEWVSFTYTLPLYSLSLNETKRNALKERRPWKWKYSLSQPTFSAKKVGSEV